MISPASGAGDVEIADEILVGGADQREVLRERQREDHAAVAGLQDIAAVMLEAAAHDDVAALDQPHRRLQRLAHDGLRDLADPGPGGVDQHARGGGVAAAAVVEHQFPVRRAARRACSACAVRMTAPRSAASSALSTTRRESSTQQSEYSKP